MLKRNSIYSLIITAILSLHYVALSSTENNSHLSQSQATSTQEPTQKDTKNHSEVRPINTTSQSCDKTSIIDKANTKTHNAAKEITITDLWARASIASNRNSAAYFKISNPTSKEIVIIGAEASGIANSVELHNSFVDEKGISRMSTLDRVVVPANADIEFKPAGLHVMLFDLKTPLQSGDKFVLKLILENDKDIQLEGNIRD